MIIIGANGFLGSFLVYKSSDSINVISDNDNNKKNNINYSTFLNNLNNNLYINEIICICASYKANTQIIKNLLNTKTNTLILFSSVVIYDGINKDEYFEDDSIDNITDDNYVNNIKLNENEFFKLEGKKIIIRLGTLYGFSPNMNASRGINRMIYSSLINNKLYLSNKKLKKSMLSLEDLYSGLDIILLNKNNILDNNIYNISSFNTTIEAIGNYISDKFDIPIIDIFLDKKDYEFTINVAKLKLLGWEAQSNITTIYDDITKNIHLCNEIKYYDGENNIIIWYVKDKCRVCNSKNLFKILDLNNQVTPNRLSDTFYKFINFPLQLYGCHECYHLQLYGVINPIIMYRKYTYLSKTASTMKNYFSNLVDKIIGINNNKSVLDIACNDGGLLDYFLDKGLETYGIDPAENITKNIKNHNIYTGFFNNDSIKYFNKFSESNEKKFDIITILNVFAHVDNIYDFLDTLSKIVTPDTDIYIQTSQCDMIQHNEFDSIYHEHLSFFNLNSMIITLRKHKFFYLHNLDIMNTHGNSYLFHIKQYKTDIGIDDKIYDRLQYEIKSNLYSLETYKKYESNIIRWKNNLLNILINNNDKIIICAGCSAKCVVLLQYIYDDLIKNNIDIKCIDENKLKINEKIESVNININSFDYIKTISINKPILFIMTAWNFKVEIIHKIQIIRPFNNLYLNLFPLNIE